MQLVPSGLLVSTLKNQLGDRLCGTAGRYKGLGISAKEPAQLPKPGQTQPWTQPNSVSFICFCGVREVFLAFFVWVF